MALRFDPAIAAHTAFELAQSRGELGPDGPLAAEWQTVFSGSVGEEATAAYRHLLALGSKHPKARAFQEFLIYSTWQQAAEEPIREHFERGVELCNRLLAEGEHSDGDRSANQVRALRTSFLNALGTTEPDDVREEYDRDSFKGGD